MLFLQTGGVLSIIPELVRVSEQARDMLILDGDNNIPYLGWDRESQTLRTVKDHGGAVLPMMLELGMRTKEAQLAWAHLQRICHSGLRRTVVMGMRGEKMGRSALATTLQKMIAEPSGPYVS
ncbi:unnamed protein product [Symbiodinium sp. CCMP2456]|nr:unnamed protein product [Symbiodinium sp. CCMP2456]